MSWNARGLRHFERQMRRQAASQTCSIPLNRHQHRASTLMLANDRRWFHVVTTAISNCWAMLLLAPPAAAGAPALVPCLVARSIVDPPPASGSTGDINFSECAWALSIVARACHEMSSTIAKVPPTDSSITSKEPRPPIALSRPSATSTSDCTDPA